MENAESTRERTTGNGGSKEVDQRLLMSSKPLHRFVQREPRSLGIVIAIFGCAELLAGFNLAGETMHTSTMIYVPYWQGILFLVCGGLSIYTEIHPSKKMVTVSLAMYVASLFGIAVSVVYRILCITLFMYYSRYRGHNDWSWERYRTIKSIEAILLTSSLCVSVLLIFLCVVARLALKSTRTQVIIQQIPAPQTIPTTSN